MNKYLNDPVRQVRKDDLSANLIRMRAVPDRSRRTQGTAALWIEAEGDLLPEGCLIRMDQAAFLWPQIPQ